MRGPARTFAQRLFRLGADFNQFVEQQAREEKAQSDSLGTGLERIQKGIEHLERAGKWRRQYFNLFDVIERTHCEHTHSNVLAWLLDPAQAHGLGDAFLRAFIRAAFGEELNQTQEVVVQRELENCDIVICQGSEWVLVIENKVDSAQGEGQLRRYARYWKRRFHKRYFAFLTRNGEQPACKDFRSISYDAVRRILLHLHGDAESEVFIRHFTDHIWFA